MQRSKIKPGFYVSVFISLILTADNINISRYYTVSKAINDGHLWAEEFYEKYLLFTIKTGIQHKTKRVTDPINDEQRQAKVQAANAFHTLQ